MIVKIELNKHQQQLAGIVEHLGDCTVPDLCAFIPWRRTRIQDRLYQLVNKGVITREGERHNDNSKPSPVYKFKSWGNVRPEPAALRIKPPELTERARGGFCTHHLATLWSPNAR